MGRPHLKFWVDCPPVPPKSPPMIYSTVCKKHKINVLKCMYDNWARAARPLRQGGADFMFCPQAQNTQAMPLTLAVLLGWGYSSQISNMWMHYWSRVMFRIIFQMVLHIYPLICLKSLRLFDLCQGWSTHGPRLSFGSPIWPTGYHMLS